MPQRNEKPCPAVSNRFSREPSQGFLFSTAHTDGGNEKHGSQ
jgi:hypothetical protein